MMTVPIAYHSLITEGIASATGTSESNPVMTSPLASADFSLLVRAYLNTPHDVSPQRRRRDEHQACSAST